ncbi:Vacuolar amino acid transporter, putative, partial [Candida maltosa Xu316]
LDPVDPDFLKKNQVSNKKSPKIFDQINKQLPDDDILIDYIYELLDNYDKDDSSSYPDISDIHTQITDFLGEKESLEFCKQLWTLIIDASKEPNGVPKEFIEADKSKPTLNNGKQTKTNYNRSANNSQDQPKRYNGSRRKMATPTPPKSSSNGYVSIPQTATTANHISQDPNSQERITDEFELQTLNSLDYEYEQQNQDEEAGEEQTGSSTMRMAFMNMANSILGAGIIGQPYAFRNSGLVGGILVMILLTILIDWTLRLIITNSILSQTKSYQDTVNYCFGLWGKILLLASICSFAYGGCMAFCVIIGDTIPHVLKAFIPNSIAGSGAPLGWLFSRNSIIVLFTACISYPLSLNRDISKLAKASGFALFGMLIIVVLTIFRGPFAAPELKGNLSVKELTFNSNIFQNEKSYYGQILQINPYFMCRIHGILYAYGNQWVN